MLLGDRYEPNVHRRKFKLNQPLRSIFHPYVPTQYNMLSWKIISKTKHPQKTTHHSLKTAYLLPHSPLPIRTYATPTPHPTRTPTHKPFLTLDRFIQRQRAIALYRAIIRATNQIPKKSSARAEIRDFARAEFERSRNVEDILAIRGFIGRGREEFEKARGFMEGLG